MLILASLRALLMCAGPQSRGVVAEEWSYATSMATKPHVEIPAPTASQPYPSIHEVHAEPDHDHETLHADNRVTRVNCEFSVIGRQEWGDYYTCDNTLPCIQLPTMRSHQACGRLVLTPPLPCRTSQSYIS